MLGSVPVAWGSIVACASPQTLGAPVVGPSNGCSYLDANFDNFTVTPPTGSGSSSFSTVTGANGSDTNLEFAASGATSHTLDFQTTGQSSGSSGCTSLSWCVVAGVASQSFTYDLVSTTPIRQLSLTDGTLQTSTIKDGSVITTEEQFCLGSATFNCTASSATYGYLQIQQTSSGAGQPTTVFTVCMPGVGGCTVSTPSAATIGLGPQTQIAIQNTVTISTIGGGAWPVFLDSFDNYFSPNAPNPEPSTFILLGGALAGLGLFRLRRKRT